MGPIFHKPSCPNNSTSAVHYRYSAMQRNSETSTKALKAQTGSVWKHIYKFRHNFWIGNDCWGDFFPSVNRRKRPSPPPSLKKMSSQQQKTWRFNMKPISLLEEKEVFVQTFLENVKHNCAIDFQSFLFHHWKEADNRGVEKDSINFHLWMQGYVRKIARDEFFLALKMSFFLLKFPFTQWLANRAPSLSRIWSIFASL